MFGFLLFLLAVFYLHSVTFSPLANVLFSPRLLLRSFVTLDCTLQLYRQAFWMDRLIAVILRPQAQTGGQKPQSRPNQYNI